MGHPGHSSFAQVIGGKVLDTTALYGVVRGNTYMAAVGSWAVEMPITLLIPATAWARALLDSDAAGRRRLARFGTLEAVVFAEFTVEDIPGIVENTRGHGVPLDAVQAVHLGVQRGWDVITSRPDELLVINSAVHTETIG